MPTALSPDLATRLDAATVDPAILERWPTYRVAVLVADGLDRRAIEANAAIAEQRLAAAETTVRESDVTDWTTHPHIAGWFEAFKGFGAKPKKTSPSCFALVKRAGAGLPRIDPLTDLYNAVSVAHVLPIGGEDFATYVGAPSLTIADGSEPFDVVVSGVPAIEHPDAGEPVWRDDAGITCRRWNWRQCVRTRIGDGTTSVLFLLEAIDGMTDAQLTAAADALATDLETLSPGVAIGRRIIARG